MTNNSNTHPSSTSDNMDYTSVCKLAATTDEHFSNFKRNKEYNKILEHVSPPQGEAYYRHISSPDILKNFDKFKVNDIFGGPNLSVYDFGVFSPSTLRYVKVLDDLENFQLNDVNIVEIGAGYGGQYTVMRQMFKPKKYTFVDLPDTLNLIKKYVGLLKLDDIELEYLTYQDLNAPIHSHLLISNYAISECSKAVQDVYINNIVHHAKHGYITYNTLVVNEMIYSDVEFISKLPFAVEKTDETPSFFHKNVLIYW